MISALWAPGNVTVNVAGTLPLAGSATGLPAETPSRVAFWNAGEPSWFELFERLVTGPVPSELTLYTWLGANTFGIGGYDALNAICVPSGDQVGPASPPPPPFVICTGFVPSASITKMCGEWVLPDATSPTNAIF